MEIHLNKSYRDITLMNIQALNTLNLSSFSTHTKPLKMVIN